MWLVWLEMGVPLGGISGGKLGVGGVEEREDAVISAKGQRREAGSRSPLSGTANYVGVSHGRLTEGRLGEKFLGIQGTCRG